MELQAKTGDMDHEELGEYEMQRLEHIRRNQEFMRRLGIESSMTLFGTKTSNEGTSGPAVRVKKPSKPKVDIAPEDCRRSSRLVGKMPDYTGEIIEQLEDGREVGASGSGRKRKHQEEDEEEPWGMEQVLADSQKWLELSRAALLQVGSSIGHVPQNQADWRQEAENRWGNRIPAHVPDWELYVTSRMSTPPPPSTMDLMQEYYAHDTWQLLICCVLMSRVSSAAVKHNTISAFFEKYPTPSAAIEARSADVLAIIAPLGLFPTRMKAVVEVTRSFLELPEFRLSLEKPFKVYGIGEFGMDSYLLFCRNAYETLNPKDRTLKAFVSWMRKHHKNLDGETSDGAGKDGN